MAKKRDTKSTSVSRRDFLKRGVAAGVGTAALGVSAATPAQGTSLDGIKWDYEADLVVIGSGASGLPCAIRARDAGLRCSLFDQNFDVGGKMLHSGGQISLGGGDPVPVAGHRGRRRQGRLHQGRPAAQAGGADRGSGLPVQGHDRLVGRSTPRRTRPTATTNASCIAPGPTTATRPGNS